MDNFGDRDWMGGSKTFYGKSRIAVAGVSLMIVLLGLWPWYQPVVSAAQGKGVVAVLPFRIHALKRFENLQLDLQKTLVKQLMEVDFQPVGPPVQHSLHGE